MHKSHSSEYARFAALLPELAAVVLRRENNPTRIASAGARLGGLLAWGVEQARFSAELAGPELTDACQTAAFPSVPPVPVSHFRAYTDTYQHSAAVARFKGVSRSGEPLELLVSHPVAKGAITADGLIAHKLIRLIHSRPKRMSAADLAHLSVSFRSWPPRRRISVRKQGDSTWQPKR